MRVGLALRHFLLTDLEGPAGVWQWSQTREEGRPKRRAMRLLTDEVGAVADGILDADPAAEIAVWDGHGSGGIVYERLHPRTVLLPGQVPLLRALRMGWDALYFVGQHAMAGTEDAPLCHTYSSRTVAEYRLNGQPVGEFGCRQALAAELGIPTVMIAGDDRAVAEARAVLPDIVAVATKIGLGVEAAMSISTQACHAALRAAAASAARRLPVPASPMPPPYVLRIEMLPGHGIGGWLAAGARADGPRAAVFEADRLAELRGI